MKNGRLMFLYAQNYEGDFFLWIKTKKKWCGGCRFLNMVVFILGNDEQVLVSTKTYAWWRSGRWLDLLVEKKLFIM